ncbi:spore germination protein [Pullulanibacillus sp. KACC 23026]|uniref:spore germination protein n=1 Tax=Pullulanibacillus sp. KACC 23026 TaxID=3028315 RepID=UPI0023AEB6BA|nr:spore germination protein [Pullulanibacillus sp. KACC 23026]WEG12335.1 spore germination protein [Pullulanibacillus sp. KACC 23026]
MPALVGPIKITAVSSAAQVNFGDALNIAPKSTSKSYVGSGSFGTGDLHCTIDLLSNTNTLDPDLIDGAIAQNN